MYGRVRRASDQAQTSDELSGSVRRAALARDRLADEDRSSGRAPGVHRV
ncbi:MULTISPECIES: hypothetical protein [unclassified Microbispora]|nr:MULTISPECIES: hypothetical protein [unclassified Microbispora]NJP27194.1 hypothetical protein [Microbispora sp. CL1-1]